ncbi:hypothetical protein [Novosphingobium mangrovi (ex Huang et al. 2023)]|uniref:Glycosyltransferase RgtA/B/C/D-like domain-containing protein n=1 Tax=Novosphingobium mangrovi (ex Huang et al. 2023) TaxID=2976432 RepID=A0ABT2I5Q8_9SPHN|nr:hypothetical protein [Novosphingobium mangrovi (ex Huang et al. 2023)]MCT2400147.1 hypothetical protein [Novosphingobium mangrovi (ex Huang et al. 2023)]
MDKIRDRFPVWYTPVLLLIGMALRASTFGDPNLHVDEAFYQTVGIAMHHGAIPYVDVWDRKPWGLFFFYYLIAFISQSPLAYQLIATVFVAATAWMIGRIASVWSSPRAGLFAGIVYLLWLDEMQGFGGQGPVFYNLFMVVAGWIVFRSHESLRAGRIPPSVPAAMLLAGIAITFKPTAFFESCFFGLYGLYHLSRSSIPRARLALNAAGWMVLGAVPAIAISAWYWLHGYWDIYWQAMVLSNLSKPGFLYASTMRALVTFIFLAPIIVVVPLSLATWRGEGRRFTTWWMFAALLGLLSVPNFYMHYSLPLLIPLCLYTATFFQRRIAGPLGLVALTLWSLQSSHAFDFEHTRQSQRAMAALADAIRTHDNGGDLFIVDGPPQLYILTGHRFPTPLVFPHHLGHLIEKDLSHLSTIGETRRVLGLRPGIVVMPDKPRQDPPNMEVIDAVTAYVTTHCRKVAGVETPDLLTSARMNVWADCRQDKGRPARP